MVTSPSRFHSTLQEVSTAYQDLESALLLSPISQKVQSSLDSCWSHLYFSIADLGKVGWNSGSLCDHSFPLVNSAPVNLTGLPIGTIQCRRHGPRSCVLVLALRLCGPVLVDLTSLNISCQLGMVRPLPGIFFFSVVFFFLLYNFF